MTCPSCGWDAGAAQVTTCAHCGSPLTIIETTPASDPDSTVPPGQRDTKRTNPLLPTPFYDLEPPISPQFPRVTAADATDAEAGAEVTSPRLPVAPLPLKSAPVSASSERGVTASSGLVKRHRLIQALVILLLVVVVVAAAAGIYIVRQNPNTYQSSLKGSLDGWETGAGCAAKADGYHIMSSSICYVPIGSQTNADVKVTVVQLSGSSELFYGIAIRSVPGGHYYLFAIDGYGRWVFVNVPGPSQAPVDLVTPTLDNAVHGGMNQANTLEVKMKGSRFDFYINGTQVGEFMDSHYGSGQIGLSGEDGVAVVYTDLSIVKVR